MPDVPSATSQPESGAPKHPTTPSISRDDVIESSIEWDTWCGELLGIQFDAWTGNGRRTYHLYDRGTDEDVLQYCWSYGGHADDERFCQDHDGLPEDVEKLIIGCIGMMGFEIDVKPPVEVFDIDD